MMISYCTCKSSINIHSLQIFLQFTPQLSLFNSLKCILPNYPIDSSSKNSKNFLIIVHFGVTLQSNRTFNKNRESKDNAKSVFAYPIIDG